MKLRHTTVSTSAFTLIEMLLVLTIIGFLASLTLPHISGIGKANTMTAATRQLLDDVGYARQKAIQSRSTVYMVFLPPSFWENSNAVAFNSLPLDVDQVTNLVVHQYSAYSLLSLRSVGDQVGRAYPRYLTDWRPLPKGVIIPPFQFVPGTTNYVTNWMSSETPFPLITNASFNWMQLPFPTTDAASNKPNFYLPFIAFNPMGQLTSGRDEFIPLSRGTFMPLRDTNGLPLLVDVLPVETPVGNGFSNYNIIHINAQTGRARVEKPQLQ